MSEQPAAKKRIRLTKVHIIVFVLILALSAAWYYILGDTKFLFVSTILFCFWGFSKKTGRNVILLILATAMVLWLGMGTSPLMLSSQTLWKYPFQRAYIGLYHNITEPDWFPDFEGDVKGGYEFDYMASMLQGTGHYSVYFETDEETVKRYTDDFSKQAKYSFTFEEYSTAPRTMSVPSDNKEKQKNSIGDIPMFVGGRYDGCASADVTVYVLETNFDHNHPHTSAVMIDTQKNTVFLSRLG